MSIIDQLIQIKTQAKNEDILYVMDELVKYEKLVKLPAFQDIANQPAIQKKIPFLWKAMQHDTYAQTLLVMAGHICGHLTGETPEFIDTILGDIKTIQQRRLTLMQQNAFTVQYRDLISYDDDAMSDTVIGIYSQKRKQLVAILIVTYQASEYIVYQGYYTEKEMPQIEKSIPIYICKKKNFEISIQTYSLQGNNSYQFATLAIGTDILTVCMPDNKRIKLQQVVSNKLVDNPPFITLVLTQEQQNKIVMSLAHVEDFTSTLLDILVNSTYITDFITTIPNKLENSNENTSTPHQEQSENKGE